MAKRGRPSKLDSIDLSQVEKLSQYGLIDTQIADCLGICEATLNNYKSNPEFLASLKKGKELSDNKVERSLFDRANGYEHPEDKIFCNAQGKVKIVPTIKHYPPDTAACIFWLKNRRSNMWKDTPLIDQSQHTHYQIEIKETYGNHRNRLTPCADTSLRSEKEV